MPGPESDHRDRDMVDLLKSLIALIVTVMFLFPGSAIGQEDAGAGEHSHDAPHHHQGLHFSHPMMTESVSPDSKVRLDHQFFRFAGGEEEHSGVLEAEYAFHRTFSIEAGIPYSYTATAAGNLELHLKFANYAFEDRGLLLGYGLGMAFPTNGEPSETHTHEEEEAAAAAATVASSFRPRFSSADGGTGVAGTLGTEEYELEPFLNAGFQSGAWDVVGWLIFGIPFNQDADHGVHTELSYDLSVLYHLSPRLQALFELNGSGGISGEAVGEDIVNVSPGLKFRPVPRQPLFLGVSVGFPVTRSEAFDTRIAASAFWHFQP